MTKLYAFFTFLLITLSPAVYTATIEQALIDYHNEKFDKAFEGFNELAEIGNTKAQFNIGVMYARGEHVDQDFVKSWAWFTLNKFNSGEDVEKVLALVEGKLDKAKKQQAFNYFEELKKEYSNKAIAKKLFPSTIANNESDFQAAKVSLKTRPKYPVGMLRTGLSGIVDLEYMIERDGSIRYPSVLSSTNGSFSDAAVAAILKSRYEPATLNGKPVHEYGRRMRFIFEMEGAEIDYRQVDRIFKPLKEKAETGGGQDKYQYAYTISMISTLGYHLDEDNKMELENPNEWFARSAQDGFSPAKYELGKRLAYGTMCAVDSNKALFWLEQAAQQNLPEAQLMLGLEYLSGARAKKDISMGKALVKKAASAGYKHAVLRYGLIVSSAETRDSDELNFAKTLADKIKARSYADKLSYYETMAALNYALGDTKMAQKMYKKGVKAAKKVDQKALRLHTIEEAIRNNTQYIETI